MSEPMDEMVRELQENLRSLESLKAKTEEARLKARLELSRIIRECCGDPDAAHVLADVALTSLLRDLGLGDVADAFESIGKWYA